MWCSDSDSDSFNGSDSDSGEGKRKRSLARSLDYECVERFRLRRLLAFLQHHRYDGAYEALSKETKVLFRTEHLQHLVREGLWCDAIKYVYRFMPASNLPRHGTFLVKFIIFVLRINDHSYEYDPRSPFQIHLHRGVSRGGVKLAKIISSVRSNEACSIDWSLVRIKAAEIVGELVAQIPDFSDLSRLPFCSAKPANVLPIGLRSRCHKVHKKKSRMPADAVARSFLTLRRLIPSEETSDSDIPLEPVTMTRLAKLVEECLQAGRCLMPNAKHPIESSCAEGLEMIAGAAVHQDVVPGSNPKRPQAAEDQMIAEARTLKITGKLRQDSGASCFLGEETARDVGSNLNRWSGGHGDCWSPTEIESS